jgi:hypothetical protein
MCLFDSIFTPAYFIFCLWAVVQAISLAVNHENANVRNIGQGEARHRKYKRLKLGGGQAYDRSSD